MHPCVSLHYAYHYLIWVKKQVFKTEASFEVLQGFPHESPLRTLSMRFEDGGKCFL